MRPLRTHPVTVRGIANDRRLSLADQQLGTDTSHALVIALSPGVILHLPGKASELDRRTPVCVPSGTPFRVSAPVGNLTFIRVFEGSDGALSLIHGRDERHRNRTSRIPCPQAVLLQQVMGSIIALQGSGLDERHWRNLSRLLMDALYAALANPWQEAKGGNPLVVLGTRWLEQHFHDPAANLNALAHHLDRHPDTVARAFKHQIQQKPMDYLRELRLAHARDLLLKADLSISQVAKACGFRDRRHFTKIFHEATGYPPKLWRRHGHRGRDLTLSSTEG